MATGQLRVAAGDLSYEDRPGEPYRFFVRAIDPSGETGEIEVAISLIDGNDPPVIGGITRGNPPPSTMRVNEQVEGRTSTASSQLTSGEDHQNVFSVTDEDSLRGQVTMSLEGEDSGAFLLADVVIDGRGGLRVLLFDNAPDYQRPADRYGHNVYRVTLVATDSAGAETRRPLTVLVNNVPQGGGMTVESAGADPLQPEAGQWVRAGLNDADGEVAPVTWQWSRGETDTERSRVRDHTRCDGPILHAHRGRRRILPARHRDLHRLDQRTRRSPDDPPRRACTETGGR